MNFPRGSQIFGWPPRDGETLKLGACDMLVLRGLKAGFDFPISVNILAVPVGLSSWRNTLLASRNRQEVREGVQPWNLPGSVDTTVVGYKAPLFQCSPNDSGVI